MPGNDYRTNPPNESVINEMMRRTGTGVDATARATGLAPAQVRNMQGGGNLGPPGRQSAQPTQVPVGRVAPQPGDGLTDRQRRLNEGGVQDSLTSLETWRQRKIADLEGEGGTPRTQQSPPHPLSTERQRPFRDTRGAIAGRRIGSPAEANDEEGAQQRELRDLQSRRVQPGGQRFANALRRMGPLTELGPEDRRLLPREADLTNEGLERRKLRENTEPQATAPARSAAAPSRATQAPARFPSLEERRAGNLAPLPPTAPITPRTTAQQIHEAQQRRIEALRREGSLPGTMPRAPAPPRPPAPPTGPTVHAPKLPTAPRPAMASLPKAPAPPRPHSTLASASKHSTVRKPSAPKPPKIA
jgi:hypothetical protein